MLKGFFVVFNFKYLTTLFKTERPFLTMLKYLYAINLNFKSNDKFNSQILVKYREEMIYCFLLLFCHKMFYQIDCFFY